MNRSIFRMMMMNDQQQLLWLNKNDFNRNFITFTIKTNHFGGKKAHWISVFIGHNLMI
jgi:hypothetical protein